MWLLLLITVPSTVRSEIFREDFTTDPVLRGWQVQGDASHFVWNSEGGRLAVTWDSQRPNAFYFLPLPTILARSDTFRFRFSLVLDDIRTLSPETTFQIAAGLLHRADALTPTFFRGSGIHPAWGARNLVEFDYFIASQSIPPTFSAVAVATNHTRWATLDLFPAELEPGRRYEIEVEHRAEESALHLRVLRDGVPFVEGRTQINDRFGDFRLDAFSLTSYSGDHQPAGYGGHVIAHGTIDDIEIEFPSPPAALLNPPSRADPMSVSLTALPGWTPALERSTDGNGWEAVPITLDPGNAEGRWSFSDPDPPAVAAFYRVRLDRP